jgi:hypothetical protein
LTSQLGSTQRQTRIGTSQLFNYCTAEVCILQHGHASLNYEHTS